MKIAVYAIALNEEAFAERFMASCQDADLVLVADTGSTDRTVEALKALGADVRPIRIDPWRFDAARNAALALVPDDVDACVSLDLDQTLAPGWRPIVEAAWAAGANQLYYTHVFTRAGPGGEVRFRDNRIHARTGFFWRYPCHECLIAEPGTAPHSLVDMQLRILHEPDLGKSRADYLPLLELAVAEAPDDPRAAHYLGREYYSVGRHADAVRQFERHLALSAGAPSPERNASVRFLAHCREALGDLDGALALFEAAVADAPQTRGAWVALAWAQHRRRNWAACLDAAERAIGLAAQNADFGDDTSPGVVVEDLACLASWSLGHPLTALDYARDALAKAPGSERIRANLERIEAALARKGPQGFGVSLTPIVDEAKAAQAAGPSKRRRKRAAG